MTDRSHTSGRRQLILMLLIAVASLSGSWALYLSSQSGNLWGTTNQGSFVDPPVNVSELQLRQWDGTPLGSSETWWVWILRDSACDAPCQDAMHQLRQLHVLLHRDADRVQRALVTPGPIDVRALKEQYPELAVLNGRVEALAPGIYIVDPLGNLVFHYPLESAGKPVLKDLKRLLKVSQIG